MCRSELGDAQAVDRRALDPNAGLLDRLSGDAPVVRRPPLSQTKAHSSA